MVSDSGRSRRYPTFSLEEALEYCERINTEVGFTPASREVLAQAIGYSGLSGPAARKLAALSYFGLLRKDSKGLRLSPMAGRILVPTSEQERKEALVDAAQGPSLYQELFERFAGGPLPSMLSNMMARDFGIVQKKAEGAAEKFRQTVEFAGLLRNGILYTDLAASGAATEEPPAPGGEPEPGTDGVETEARAELGGLGSRPGTRDHLVPLTGGTAVVRLPDPLSSEDLVRVQKWAGLMAELIDE